MSPQSLTRLWNESLTFARRSRCPLVANRLLTCSITRPAGMRSKNFQLLRSPLPANAVVGADWRDPSRRRDSRMWSSGRDWSLIRWWLILLWCCIVLHFHLWDERVAACCGESQRGPELNGSRSVHEHSFTESSVGRRRGQRKAIADHQKPTHENRHLQTSSSRHRRAPSSTLHLRPNSALRLRPLP